MTNKYQIITGIFETREKERRVDTEIYSQGNVIYQRQRMSKNSKPFYENKKLGEALTVNPALLNYVRSVIKRQERFLIQGKNVSALETIIFEGNLK